MLQSLALRVGGRGQKGQRGSGVTHPPLAPDGAVPRVHRDWPSSHAVPPLGGSLQLASECAHASLRRSRRTGRGRARGADGQTGRRREGPNCALRPSALGHPAGTARRLRPGAGDLRAARERTSKNRDEEAEQTRAKIWGCSRCSVRRSPFSPAAIREFCMHTHAASK